jgi:predicted peptidase
LRWGCAATLLAIVESCAVAFDLTKDDIDFRKEVYVNKKGGKLPYRLFVPIGCSSANTYPLVLWLHGGEGRGNDNVKQITRGNEKGTHAWISSEVQPKFPAFVLAPQCTVGENWSDPELNQPTDSLQLALEILARVEKQWPHLCCGPIDGWIGCVVAAANASGKMGGRGGSGGLR